MTPTGPRELTAQRRLVELEGTIQGGLDSFVAVGQALLEIRDSRLYRFGHGTFEDYCKARWGISRSRSYQLMDAAAVSTVVDTDSEAQARELAPVMRSEGPDAAREVWAETVARSEGKPTAAVIREVVAERRPDPAVVAFREQVLANDPRVQLSELRLTWTKVLSRLSGFPLVDPAEYVPYLERDEIESWHHLSESMHHWLDTVDGAMAAASKPRVVEGGRS